MGIRTVGVLLALVACGKSDEEQGCSEVAVLVHVTNPANEGIEGADVSMGELTCDDLGAGDYQCMVEPGRSYKLYAVKTPEYEPYGITVDVEEPASCDDVALERDIQLQVESAV